MVGLVDSPIFRFLSYHFNAVARFSMGTRRFLPQDYQIDIAEVNGQPATVFRADGKAFLALAIEVEAWRIQTVRLMANPERLSHI